MPTPETVRRAYREDEEKCVAARLDQARLPASLLARTSRLAAMLAEAARAEGAGGGFDAFLASYDLASEEGVALMCVAEALLRIPDAATRDRLIADKIGGADWQKRLGASDSLFVNASTYGLMLTGRLLALGGAHEASRGLGAALGNAVARLGEPVIRGAIAQAMGSLGRHFVFGRTIEEAIARGRADRKAGNSQSFDMLGEAARTESDAARYARAYADAIAAVGALAAGEPGRVRPGVSIKLSALHPRYEFARAEEVRAALLPLLRDLATAAGGAGIGLTIDAEEADRLELSLDIFEALLADDALFANGWSGFGLAIQAYQKRAVPLIDHVIGLARRHGRRLAVRLVKGAYWDSEIKATQIGGYADYPVFTRKQATDVSYLACARRMLEARDVLHPAFATHNAYSIAAIRAMADGTEGYEFQRLHGMGESLYDALARHDVAEGRTPTPVRIYAPVGGHKDLLAYLVRRLLENGSNSSFVRKLSDGHLALADLIADPVAELAAMPARRNPAIPLPADLLLPERRNSAGIDLSDPLVRGPLLARLDALAETDHAAAPSGLLEGARAGRPVRSPQDGRTVGMVVEGDIADVDRMVAAGIAAQPRWDALSADARAAALEKAAGLFEEDRDALLSLCVREAGKTLPDAIAELREAVDFLHYYAALGRRQFGGFEDLPGPTGEANRLRLAGRGLFVAISPWNFPLAIFTGQVAAALMAGNAVIAKPAGQTPLIAARAVAMLHRAGVPADVLHLLPGGGVTGAAAVADPRIAGVVFTGSTRTARAINRSLSERDGPIVPLIAETGGQNAMIVDSSALPEQVTRDVIASAFQSAGQRCSALRMLYLQEEVADDMIAMIAGAMRTLNIGDPARLDTDVGPVIDADARAALDAHIAELEQSGRRVCRLDLPPSCAHGHFVAPAAYEIEGIARLDREHFGPILHIARYRAKDLDAVVDAINATGFGLTLGIHSRISKTIDRIVARARVGNVYVNRNQIGAVVGVQPFGGEGLSGTGPKAGGPHYLLRFAVERSLCIDTTAAGGNAALLAA